MSRLKRDTNANIAVIFALALVPILATIGSVIDYSMATRIKAKLQGSSDSASVAAISVNSAGYTAAMAMTSNGSVSAGVTEANNIFNGNAATFSSSYTNLGVTSTVTKTGNKLTSNVQFSADGNSIATVTAPPYSISLNTTTLSNASHTLTAVATDSLGKTNSASVTVTVSNVTPQPTISFTSPANNSTVSGTIAVSASATPNGTATINSTPAVGRGHMRRLQSRRSAEQLFA